MNFFYIFIGLSLAIFGIGIIYDPIFHDTKHNFIHDFTEVKWPFGVLLILIGIGFLYFSLRKGAGGSISEFLICPTCRKSYDRKELSENRCSTCDIDLEKLDGFYERHPELKEK